MTTKPETTMYRVIVSPFKKEEAIQIRNYLTAFMKDKTVDIEAISP